VDEVEVLMGDLAGRQHLVLDPVEQAAPEGRADQHDRESRDLLCLDEGDRLEQFVKGAEPAGQHDERLGILHEHRLADEEVAELDADVDVIVQALLEGQLDAQPDGDAAGLDRPAVRGLHDPRTTACDHGVPGLGQRRTDSLGHGVLIAVGLGTRGAEDAHRMRQIGQQPEPFDELGLDAQHTPGIGVHPVRGPPIVEQTLVRGRGGDRLAAERDRPLPSPARLIRSHGKYRSHRRKLFPRRRYDLSLRGD
jgi:hypothetical protein